VSKVILFLREENLPDEQSEAQIPRAKKKCSTNELHTNFFWRPLSKAQALPFTRVHKKLF
jgi:hypothetical protein